MDADRQHEIAFGNHAGITPKLYFDDLKNNAINRDCLVLDSSDTAHFTNLAWKLLGQYSINNTHLTSIFFLRSPNFTDENMALLFGELLSSSSISSLTLRMGEFGIDGIRSMVPFLQNSPELKSIDLSENRRINTECFELLVQTLHYSSISELFFYQCNNKDISALETYNLPYLQYLNLNGSRIGNEGCSILSNLLQRESTTLKKLILVGTGMGDEEAAIIATSLKHNTQLETLHMGGNALTERGLMVFFKLVIDVSSIETIYKCNHTLSQCWLSGFNDETTTRMMMIQNQINASLNGDDEPSCRMKVINFMLNSRKRKDICTLQGIDNPSNIFTDIEPVTLLPNVLALIGNEHGQSELYTALKPTAPELLAYIDRKAMIQDAMANIAARKSTLSDEYAQRVVEYERRMAEYEAAHKRISQN